MASPFKLNPLADVPGELQERSILWKQDSKIGKSWQATVKNPAYCKVGSYPDTDFEKYNQVYGKFKLKPILKSATLTMGGNYGLTMTLDAEIQTFSKGDFESVEATYCRMGKKVKISFGYAKPADPAYDSSSSIGGFIVCKYSFSTNDDGSWTSKFTAVAPAEALNSTDITMQPTNLGAPLTFLLKGSERHIVTGIAELMQYHAQGNGATATKEQPDGYVNVCKVRGEFMGHCAVFDLKEMLTEEGGVNRIFSWIAGVIGNEDDNHVYYTLEYCANMWNKVARTGYPDLKSNNIGVYFSEYSKSYIHQRIQSARPIEVLFLGGGYGNYLANGLGKNFDTTCKDLASVNSDGKKAGKRHIINLSKILIERSVILAALNASKPEKKSAETNDVKEKQETNVTVKQFFNTIFEAIDRASGGAMKLRLAHNPNTFQGTEMNKLTIVDEANGYLPEALTCVVFDPIDGDGSTRTCSLTSDAGSQTFQAAMFAGTHKSGDSCANVAGLNAQAKRQEAAKKAGSALNELLFSPGKAQKSGFSEESMKAIEEANSALATYGGETTIQEKGGYDQLVYPGLGIDITIDGVWGFRPGNAISTTQLPASYATSKGIYFYVDTVVHQWDGESSDWTTKLTGKLNTHNNLAPVRL